MLFEILGFLLFLAILLYVFVRLNVRYCYCYTCLIGKTAIVTGGNAGMGYEIALNLASRGCRVIIADIDDAKATKAKIVAKTSNDNIAVKHLDLSSFTSIREFVKDIIETEPRLDILINNAGIGMYPTRKTKDGLHPLMQVNYYGPFLLTYLLVDLLRKSAPSRILFTSSSIAFLHTYLNDKTNKNSSKLQTKRYFWNVKLCPSYANSKFLNIIAAKKFNEKLKNSNVECYSLDPGWVFTNITWNHMISYLNLNYFNKFSKFLLKYYCKTAKEGAQTAIHLALSKKLKNLSGQHFAGCEPSFVPFLTEDEEFCDKVWTFSKEIIGLKVNENFI